MNKAGQEAAGWVGVAEVPNLPVEGGMRREWQGLELSWERWTAFWMPRLSAPEVEAACQCPSELAEVISFLCWLSHTGLQCLP